MENERRKIGLITYHAAYNCGAVLQAYATQKTLEKLGFPNEIVDYQTRSEIFCYHKDFSWRKGLRNWISTFGFFFIRKARRIRREKFEQFINHYLTLSPRRYATCRELQAEKFGYETLVSGSDQIWNISCGEFLNEPREAILPYFLDFAHPKKKIAYASSIGDYNNLNYIKSYAPYLKQFNALSVREPRSARLIGKAIGRPVELVADPTQLFTREEWQIAGTYRPKTSRKYLLIYTLYWMPWTMKKWLAAIKQIAHRFNLDVYCISPMNYYHDNEVHWLNEAGPLDFLSYMSHASLIITNTFHGTIFPMNFNVPFYSCAVREGTRQGHILEMCDLEDRILNSPSELCEITDYSCDFTTSNAIMEELRHKSMSWLDSVLKSC